MRTKRFIYNSASFALLQLVTIAGGIVLTRMILTTYGSEINGLVSSVAQFVSYFSYVEAGLGTALIFALYKPLADRDEGEVDGIVTLAKREYFKAGTIYFILVLLLSGLYPLVVKNETTSPGTIVLLVLVIGAFGALEFFAMAKYRVLIIADQREYVISLVLLLAYLVNFATMAGMVWIQADIVWVRTVPLVSFAVRGVLLSWYVNKNYPYITYKGTAKGTYLKRRWDALVMKLGVSINTSAPIVLISVFASLKMASVYAIYNMVFSGLIALTSIFTAGVSALLGNMVANEEKEKLRGVHDEFEWFIFLVTTVLYACALIMIEPFILLYTKGITDIEYNNLWYGYLFVLWGMVFNIRIPYTALINASGLYRESRNVNVIQVLFLIVSATVGIRFFGLTGVLAAMVLSVSYWVVGLVCVVGKAMDVADGMKTLRRSLRMLLIVLLSYIPFKWGLLPVIERYDQWVLWAGLAFGWSFILGIVVHGVLDRKAFRSILARLIALKPQKRGR